MGLKAPQMPGRLLLTCFYLAALRLRESCLEFMPLPSSPQVQEGVSRLQGIGVGAGIAVVSGREDLNERTPLRRGEQQLEKQRQGHREQLDNEDPGVAQRQAEDAGNDCEGDPRQQENADEDQAEPEKSEPVDRQRAQ